jgi:two-component system, cell cycle response regulator CpdR
VAVAISVNNRIVSIVDDYPDIAILFYDALKSIAGITIFTFTDPIQALEHFRDNEHAYVVIISDFKMLGLNCMEFLKKIKDSNPFVRTILKTAFEIDDKIFREYTKMKIINGFLQKPIGLYDLIKEADTQLHSYEQQKNILPNEFSEYITFFFYTTFYRTAFYLSYKQTKLPQLVVNGVGSCSSEIIAITASCLNYFIFCCQ